MKRSQEFSGEDEEQASFDEDYENASRMGRMINMYEVLVRDMELEYFRLNP